MNLVLLLSIILAVQLPLLTYGKASLAKVDSSTLSTKTLLTTAASPKSDETKATRMRRNSIVTSGSSVNDNSADFSINSLSRDFPFAMLAAPACNEWNSDVESRDRAIRDRMRNFFDISCSKICRQKVMYDILAIQKCFNSASSSEEVYENPIERLRRGKLDVNDMFMPVRGRRTKPTSDIVAEKKAPLDVLKNDLFMPNRGRRDFPDIIRPSDYFNMKRNGIDLNSKDYFMPNRGRREQSIDSLLSENFFPQRGKKSTSDMILEVPWLVPNRPRPPVDRNMIDLLRDLNQIMNEANKDITAAVQLETAATTTTTTSGDEKFIPHSQHHHGKAANMLDENIANTMMILKPTNADESTEMFKIASDGDGPANSIFTNTPFDHQQQQRSNNAFGRVTTSKFI